MRYNQKVKDYPFGKKIITFNYPIFNPELDPPHKQSVRSDYSKTENVTRDDSRKRALDRIYDIAYANDFTDFITLTVDPLQLDRTSPEILTKAIKIWFSNLVQRNNCNYVIIPEYHKDGTGIHFHGLMSGNYTKVDSGKKVRKGHSKGKTIYNLSNWKYGWSTTIDIDGDKVALARYIIKYVTKGNEKIFGKHYLAGGKTLKREVPTKYFYQPFYEAVGNEYNIELTPYKVKYFELMANNNSNEIRKIIGEEII